MTAAAQSPAGTAAGQSDAILEVSNLTRVFGGVRAVDDCSFRVRRGTITGLIGPNGAGKTTAFNLISGFLKPTSGTIVFDGERIDGLPPHVIARKGLVRTFQIPKPLGSMTVLENLVLVPMGQEGERVWNAWFRPGLVGQREREIIDRALAVLEYVDLIRLRDEYAANLSGGQKKLLELARTLMAEPKMILLDEPGAGVNRTLMRRLVGYIEELCYERGITMFIIEHDMDLVARLCNPVIVMSEGTHLCEGTPEEVRNNPQVLEAYLGGQYR
ncbi:MAG: ABC transporter ATP-binding protein [Sphaerobacter thermophilus]|uniref:ABC transporter related protein n=1 Tax=Sphaerobacter thermophilus (strain ATCC 49802 / DSM 20745 / KCCM 41009 / NCIMB 13125 / S 6022) TaxID=479434 RepID=D1C6F5_SPHTD|nr:ABC transporter ATP-binding protein [Sphaerobacter thermophilus]ACZ39580.1 ABC transporter related protein [Sphaerobacter thermophilus DSM 20745]